MSGRETIIGECKLCGQQARLCRSHIVPEFCYKPFYDAHHRVRVLNLRLDGLPQVALIQKGVRENLLCALCEGILAKYESKFKTFWYDGPASPRQLEPECNGLVIDGADYASFKLFHLSVLWRAGVAEWCGSVSLGPYSQKISKMLLKGDPGIPGAFPIIGTALIDSGGRVLHGLITKPIRSRVGKSTVYFMCYAGCEWTFAVTDHPSEVEAQVAQSLDVSGRISLLCSRWSESNTARITARYPLRK
ncbi:MAG TPA: hypothetical protein PLP01_15320 [Phycisphaerae bacterium]|nr:hypothetical protein [Phycisphaerae bacterium]